MTTEDLLFEVLSAKDNKPEYWRDGQFVFNYIEQKYGDVAREVQFIDKIDCFYIDENIADFCKCVAERLTNRLN